MALCGSWRRRGRQRFDKRSKLRTWLLVSGRGLLGHGPSDGPHSLHCCPAAPPGKGFQTRMTLTCSLQWAVKFTVQLLAARKAYRHLSVKGGWDEGGWGFPSFEGKKVTQKVTQMVNGAKEEVQVSKLRQITVLSNILISRTSPCQLVRRGRSTPGSLCQRRRTWEEDHWHSRMTR